MPPIDGFLELVAKSGVVEPPRLEAYLDRLRSGGTLPSEPSEFAAILVRDGILTRFQTEQLLAGRWRGFFVGKYKVLERLGSGGMGTVYLGEHKLMRRRVALKVLPRSRAQDQAALDRFRREAVAVAALNHPNIVRAYDHDQDGDLHFLVMEYVDGTSLHDLVKMAGPLELDRACHYIYQAARGLEHAHAVGMVHRDIKPGNLLVDRAGVVKILDMGLARFFNEEGESLTKKYDENVLGTADYLAPEQAIDSHGVDIRADIYGLGGTFYYMLAGKSPFGEGTIAQKLIWHQTRRPKPLKEIRPEVPNELVEIVEKMMRRSPDERYAAPDEILAALEPYVQQPLAPLPEKFLPNLSPAARTGGESAASPESAAKPPSTPRGLTESTTATTMRTAPAPASPPGSTPDAQVVEESPAAAEDDEFTWGALAAKPMVATLPKPRAAPKPVTTPSATVPWIKTRNGMIISTGIGAGVLLLAVLAVVIWKIAGLGVNGAPTTPDGTPEPKTLFVSSAGEGEYRSIQDAIADANPGDQIVVRKGTVLQESLKLGETLRIKSIEAEENDAVLEPPDGHPAGEPLIAIQHVTGLTFKGFNLHGRGRCDVLIRVSGDCAGLRLEALTLDGFSHAGIRLANASGGKADAKAFRLVHVRIQIPEAVEVGPVAGVEILSATDAECRHVRIENCEFQGRMNSGLRVRARTENVAVDQCRFSNGTETAILYPPDADASHVVELNIHDCWFDGYRFAFGIEADLPLGTQLRLNGNRFESIHEGIMSRRYAKEDLRNVVVGKGNTYAKAGDKACVPGVLEELATLTAKDPLEMRFDLKPE